MSIRGGVTAANQALDGLNEKVRELEKEAAAILEAEELFSMSLTDFKDIRFFRDELTLLRDLWGHIGILESEIDSIERTKWDQLNNCNYGNWHQYDH